VLDDFPVLAVHDGPVKAKKAKRLLSLLLAGDRLQLSLLPIPSVLIVSLASLATPSTAQIPQGPLGSGTCS
jgi:hypothetical protein